MPGGIKLSGNEIFIVASDKAVGKKSECGGRKGGVMCVFVADALT